MARVQYGVIVTELKGKINGQVFQGGANGFVLRNKGYTRGSTSVLRQAANNNLVTNTSNWRNLTDGQRASWNSGTANWLFTNKFGATYTGSGFQVFNSLNTTLLSLGLTPVSTMPSVAAPNNPGTVSAVLVNNGDLVITWVNNMDSDCYLAVWASPVVSAGRNLNYPRLRRLGSTDVSGDGDNDTITYGLGGSPYPEPTIGDTVIIKVAFYKGAFPYPYFVSTFKTVAVAP
jgi:hypothetical protein